MRKTDTNRSVGYLMDWWIGLRENQQKTIALPNNNQVFLQNSQWSAVPKSTWTVWLGTLGTTQILKTTWISNRCFWFWRPQAPDDREIFATILELFGETPRGSWLPGWVVLPSDQPLCPPPNQEHSCVTAAANKPSPPGRGGNAIRAENLLFPRVAVDFLHQRIKLPVPSFAADPG